MNALSKDRIKYRKYILMVPSMLRKVQSMNVLIYGVYIPILCNAPIREVSALCLYRANGSGHHRHDCKADNRTYITYIMHLQNVRISD